MERGGRKGEGGREGEREKMEGRRKVDGWEEGRGLVKEITRLSWANDVLRYDNMRVSITLK